MNLKLKHIAMILFIFIAFFSIAVTSVYGEEVNVDMHDIRKSSDLPLSDEEILDMIEQNTPAINPKEFEEMKSNPNTLAVYGKLPEKSGVESYDWDLDLLKIAKSVQNDSDFQKYRYLNGGPVIGYGSTFTGGYMEVKINFERSELLKQEDLDQIQKIFEKYANENGIKDLPIVIVYGNMAEWAIEEAIQITATEQMEFQTKNIIAACFSVMAALILIVLIPKIRL